MFLSILGSEFFNGKFIIIFRCNLTKNNHVDNNIRFATNKNGHLMRIVDVSYRSFFRLTVS